MSRVPKTIQQKLSDLDAHLFILREHLHQLPESAGHLKVLAAELRALVCHVSGTEGLLWRLVQELEVDDRIFLHVPSDFNLAHPLAEGLEFALIPIQRGGHGDPRLVPGLYSFKWVIKEAQALLVSGEPLTHENLIRGVAEQMGTAHEDEGLTRELVELKSILIGGVEPFVPVLSTDAELTLQIGERVLEKAEKQLGYQRQLHRRADGNATAVLRVDVNERPNRPIRLLRFISYVSNVGITAYAASKGVIFSLSKHGSEVAELLAPYPPSWSWGDGAVFALSYCSETRQARTLTNDTIGVANISCDVGWLDARELALTEMNTDSSDAVEQHFALAYERLLSTTDTQALYELPPDGHGLWVHEDEIEDRGPFPD